VRESFDLLKFTDEFMPRWITDWVQKKICTQVKPVMAAGPMEGRTPGATITATPPRAWTGTIANTTLHRNPLPTPNPTREEE
jgi:hypothetical protein